MKKISVKIRPHAEGAISTEEKPFYRGECEECGKEIRFSDADITYGAYGCPMVKCPRCFV